MLWINVQCAGRRRIAEHIRLSRWGRGDQKSCEVISECRFAGTARALQHPRVMLPPRGECIKYRSLGRPMPKQACGFARMRRTFNAVGFGQIRHSKGVPRVWGR
jgi:hypothetical protein